MYYYRFLRIRCGKHLVLANTHTHVGHDLLSSVKL